MDGCQGFALYGAGREPDLRSVVSHRIDNARRVDTALTCSGSLKLVPVPSRAPGNRS